MNIICSPCNGSGIADGVTCTICGGDGERDLFGAVSCGIANGDIVRYIEAVHLAIDTKLDANAEELDYIHGKVTAIWNQVKPGN